MSADWIERFNRSIDYIEENLDGSVNTSRAAEIAGCSPFQYQRTFSYIAGVTLGEYIRRRRMTLAAADLQNEGARVIDVAATYGYDSPTAFTRAFGNVHGVPPLAARRKGTQLKVWPRLSFTMRVNGSREMNYRVEEAPLMRIAGFRIPLCADIERNFEIVPPFWRDVRTPAKLSLLTSLMDGKAAPLFGVSVYLSPDDIFYYVGAETDAAVPEGMYSCVIPPCRRAVFECPGEMPLSMQEAYRAFWTEWLPSSGYEYAAVPDIEVYPFGTPETGIPELRLGVKK